MGTPSAQACSAEYNDNIRLRTMQWAMVDILEHPHTHFESVCEHVLNGHKKLF
jgi:hypothetical protein